MTSRSSAHEDRRTRSPRPAPRTAGNAAVKARHDGAAKALAGVEVAAAAVTVALDLWIPTLVLLGMAVVSLLGRRQGPRSLGLQRTHRMGRMAAEVLGWSLLWSGWTLTVSMPVVEHLTGQRRDVSQFVPVQGNLSLLAALLLASWTLAALGEEIGYRGYVQTRLRQLLPAGTAGLVVAILGSSALFGLAHSEQGVVGVALATLDGIFFSLLRHRYRTLWAAILAHGFINSIGLLAYFVAGPFYGLW